MSTPIKRIEKDFLLKVLYDEQLPVMYFNNRTEYVLVLEKPAKDEVFFRADKPIEGLKPKKKLNLMFDYKGQVLLFSVEVNTVKDTRINAAAPEYLYKNLERSYSRISTPQDLKVQLTFQGDRYVLQYPKIRGYESGDDELMEKLDPKNLQGLIDQMSVWIKGFASGYKMVIFKETKPNTTEERILAETGKTLYLPSTMASFPQEDPYPKKRLVTEEMFGRCLESTGVDPAYIRDAIRRFVRQKFDAGFYSDIWAPILFQEYVIGYIHVWINEAGRQPLNYNVIEHLYQFAKVLAFSLKTNGYFNSGRVKNEPFDGKIIDISVSGLLFVYPHSVLSAALLPDSELAVRLDLPRRSIRAAAKIVRRYRDNTQGYFGCRFLDVMPEDMRFLFEYLYGKPFSDEDALFIAGQV
jgi:hypothetical protein